ncbi:MAG: EAL domain-containing protein [Rhodospirillales bacterium]|nr:EAL domain-containing protein [Rhodospirillales bacterium]
MIFVSFTSLLIFLLVWRQEWLNARLLTKLSESERALAHVFDLNPAVIFRLRVDENDIVPFWVSNNVTRVLGFSVAEVLKRGWWSAQIHPDDRAAAKDAARTIFATGHVTQKYKIRHKDGRYIWLREELLLVDEPTAGRWIVGCWNDVTGQHEAEERLRLDATVAKSTREGVLITDLGARILSVNQAFCDITGYRADEVLGRRPSLLRSGRHDVAFYQAMWASLRDCGYWQGEIWNRRKSGAVYPEWLTINAALDDAGHPTHYVAVFADLSQMKEAEVRVHHLTHYDPLTDLPNRLLTRSRLEHALQRAERKREQVAVLVVDLDRFKTLNDGLGLNAGDEALSLAAGRLRTRLREGDTLGRLGGDEFMVVLEEIAGPDAAAIAASDLLATLTPPIVLSTGVEAYLSASVGITIFPKDAATADELMRNADAAVAEAKRFGGGICRFYSTDFTKQASERLTLETQLRHALDREELVLHYQPLVSAATGRVIGAEALVRWQPPDGPLIPPAQFIPVAEETGLIVRLGAWVLETACAQAVAWLRAGIELDTMAVNLSAHQLRQDDLVGSVRQVLQTTGLPASRLELEICETAMVHASKQTLAVLHELRSLGVRLAIDDFGTGYSSLNYIAQLPVDKLKIDGSFVREIPENLKSTAITGAIIAMGKGLGLEVLAEGVETEAHRRFLIDHHCDTYQGFLISPPVEPAAFADVFANT